VVPVWSTYKDGAWGKSHILDVKPGTQAWYPTVDILPAGSLLFTWSSRSDDRVTIETRKIALVGTE
jgi:hypothetical protein